MDNSDLIKERVLEHAALAQERFAAKFYESVIMKSLDLIALEAHRLEIPNWESMKLGELRREIEKLQEAK